MIDEEYREKFPWEDDNDYNEERSQHNNGNQPTQEDIKIALRRPCEDYIEVIKYFVNPWVACNLEEPQCPLGKPCDDFIGLVKSLGIPEYVNNDMTENSCESCEECRERVQCQGVWI